MTGPSPLVKTRLECGRCGFALALCVPVRVRAHPLLRCDHPAHGNAEDLRASKEAIQQTARPARRICGPRDTHGVGAREREEATMTHRTRHRTWHRTWTAVVPLALVTASGGCVGGQSETCVSWVTFETPAEALADADLAVVTEGRGRPGGTTDLFGVDARVHVVRVAEVLTGAGVQVGQDLEVLSTPVTCTGGEVYPEGDPLDAPGPLVLLLHRDDAAAAWRTITPGQGVVPATDDGALPDAWPAS